MIFPSFLFVVITGFDFCVCVCLHFLFTVCFISIFRSLAFVDVGSNSFHNHKKALLSEKFLFQGREQMLRVTTPNSPMPHDRGLIGCGREMVRR
jgi:hypothetical protein